MDVEVERVGKGGIAQPSEDGQVDVEVRADSELGVAVESADAPTGLGDFLAHLVMAVRVH